MIPFARINTYGNILPPPAGIKKINAFSTGQMYLTTDGDLYVYGENTNWRFGTGSTSPVTGTPQKVISGVSDMICHPQCTLLVMSDGRFLVTGQTNGVFSVATGLMYVDITSKFTSVGIPKKIDFSRRNTANFTLYLLNTDGDLYGMGFGNRGQLGLGTNNSLGTFTKINTNCSTFASCSYETIVVLKNDQTAWFCGNYGFITTSTDVTTFTSMGDSNIRGIYGNGLNGECLYVKNDGLYVRGLASNRYGYISSTSTRGTNLKITLPFTFNVNTFSILVDETSASPASMISNSGIYYGCGSNSSTTNNRLSFVSTSYDGSNYSIQNISEVVGSIKGLMAASLYTMVLNENGVIYSSGALDSINSNLPGNNSASTHYIEFKKGF